MSCNDRTWACYASRNDNPKPSVEESSELFVHYLEIIYCWLLAGMLISRLNTPRNALKFTARLHHKTYKNLEMVWAESRWWRSHPKGCKWLFGWLYALLLLPPTTTYKSMRKAFNPTRCGWWQGTKRGGCHTKSLLSLFKPSPRLAMGGCP